MWHGYLLRCIFWWIYQNIRKGGWVEVESYFGNKKFNVSLYFVGCDLMIFASAFYFSYGNDWDVIHRARALDNQMFVAAISPARDDQASYVVYGHDCQSNGKGSNWSRHFGGNRLQWNWLVIVEKSSSFTQQECKNLESSATFQIWTKLTKPVKKLQSCQHLGEQTFIKNTSITERNSKDETATIRWFQSNKTTSIFQTLHFNDFILTFNRNREKNIHIWILRFLKYYENLHQISTEK